MIGAALVAAIVLGAAVYMMVGNDGAVAGQAVRTTRGGAGSVATAAKTETICNNFQPNSNIMLDDDGDGKANCLDMDCINNVYCHGFQKMCPAEAEGMVMKHSDGKEYKCVKKEESNGKCGGRCWIPYIKLDTNQDLGSSNINSKINNPIASSDNTVLTKCVDSDNTYDGEIDKEGINANPLSLIVKGKVTLSDNIKEDGCGPEINLVKEFFCKSDNTIDYKFLVCAAGSICKEGACVNVNAKCVDSDSDIDNVVDIYSESLFKKGIVSYGPVTRVDSCTGNNKVLEYFCDKGKLGWNGFPCIVGYNCIDGACVLKQ
jgi:hypothetical protein